MKEKIGWFSAVVLGALTAFGPFITDFYLPSIPEMQAYFVSSPSLIAMSLTSGMLGLSLGQLLIGPLSDKFGRKGLLVGSMLLFSISSVLCILAPNIIVFNLLRILQGFGGAGGVVLSKSMATDMYRGKQLADFMAILGAINGVAPVLAPVLGGAMASFTSWKGVFCLLLALGIVLMLCSMQLHETLPEGHRSEGSVLHSYGKLFKVLRNPKFLLPTLAVMTMHFAFFAYIASSSFIFQQQYGLSPLSFSLCFALNATMIVVGSLIATRFKSQARVLRLAGWNYLAAAGFVSVCLMVHLPLWCLMAGCIWLLTSFSLMQPVAMAIALDSERDNAGAASAMFGASIFLAGALSSPLVAIGNLMVSTSAVLLAGALASLGLTLVLCRKMTRGKG